MHYYKCPTQDALFTMNDVLGFEEHYETLGFEDATADIIQAIFTENAKFVENVLAPINANGDKQGCSWNDGVVTTPDGFKEAYQQYVEGGWPSLAHEVEHGGQGMPYSLSSVIGEWSASANHSWTMYPMLSQGCMETLKEYGTEAHRNMFLGKLVDGTWTGTMCLTEPHCGSDLGMLKCKAEPNDDGTYSITGTKIFISAGEHDMSENIVHLVLARLPDAPAGTKGISLFIIPKFNVSENAEIQDRNQVNCGSIEHKMGIKASATCVINFDGAKGYLIGPANRGLNCMFTFMNTARLGVGVEGVSASEAAFQGALIYAKDRLQFRSVTGVKNPDGPADPIIVHPDVRRMLLTQKTLAEGCRAMAYYCAKLVDQTLYSKDEVVVKTANDKLAFLTPIIKAFATETAQETTSHGMQVYGGHGFISEWGMEQLARDTRICTMYEGTTGIQAIDLLSRKVFGSKGQLLNLFADEIRQFCHTIDADHALHGLSSVLENRLNAWLKLSDDIGKSAMHNPEELGAASVDYIMLAGYICVGYFWLKMAAAAQSKVDAGSDDSGFCNAKIKSANFYFEKILIRADAHTAAIQSGAKSVMAMGEDEFAFL